MSEQEKKKEPHIIVDDLTMAYGSFVVMKDLNFTIDRGDVFIIMGGSGCGKSTLLRAINRMHDLYPNIDITGEMFLPSFRYWVRYSLIHAPPRFFGLAYRSR